MLIDVSSLALSLGGRPILKDVRLAVSEGEIYGLLGPNGAGKSTTIAAILGLLAADAGHVRVLGRDPRRNADEVRAHIGVLPEQNGFYDWMTAAAYLGLFARLYGRHPAAVVARDQLERVGLGANAGQRIGTFSRGMRQRLGLARALIADPQLLILDEPTNGLDPRGRRDIHDILITLAARGVGILMCSHLLDDVDRLCHRIGIIVDGTTVVEGALADLLPDGGRASRFRLRLDGEPPSLPTGDAPLRIIAREGEWWVVELGPAVRPEDAWRVLISQGWEITEIRREGSGLEALYLSLTERRAA